MSSRRLADVYKLTHLSFQLLLPLDSLPLVGQSIGVRHNNRSRHTRTSRPMMADGNKATSLVLREIPSICKGPCTPGTGNSRHIWQTSFYYLADVGDVPLEDVWMTSRTRNSLLGLNGMSAGCKPECSGGLYRTPVDPNDEKAKKSHRGAFMARGLRLIGILGFG